MRRLLIQGSGTGRAQSRPVFRALAAILILACGTASAFAGTLAEDGAAWWRIFRDPGLDRLVARAERGDVSLEQAAARLRLSQAELRGANAEGQPQLGLTAGASQQQGPLINAVGGSGGLFTAGANLSYDVDLLGRLSKARAAARLDVAASQDLSRAARLITQTQAARLYFEIAARKAEGDGFRAAAAVDDEQSAILTARLADGMASELDARRLIEQRDEALRGAVEADRRRETAEHALAALLGEAESPEVPSAASSPPSIPVPAGLPSLLLERRPDVLAGAREMDAARLRWRAARAAWFPTLELTGSGGFASSALINLLKSSAQSAAVDALFALPVLDGGRRSAMVARARAEADLAAANYKARVRAALEEFRDSLAALRAAEARTALAEADLKAATRAGEIAEARYHQGMISRLDWLAARRRVLAATGSSASSGYERATAAVGVIRALGGGWGG